MDKLQGSPPAPLCHGFTQQPGTNPLVGRVCKLHCNHTWCQACLIVYIQKTGRQISTCPKCKKFFNSKDYDVLLDKTTPQASDTTVTHIAINIATPTSSIPRISDIPLPSSFAIPKEPQQTGSLGGNKFTNITGKWYPGWPGPRK